MRKICIVLLSLIIVCVLSWLSPWHITAAGYTSNQSGNWSNPLIWTPNGVPGNGDTAVVNHAVTVDVNSIIGTSPAAGVTVLTINSVGSLTLATGVTFTVRGDVDWRDTTITMGAGSTWQFDSSLSVSPSTTSYRTFTTTCGQGNRKGIINGTLGSHVTLTSVKTNSAANGRFDGYCYGNDQWYITYADISNLGDATHASIQHSLYSANKIFYLQHVTFLNSGGITSPNLAGGTPSPNDGSDTFQLLYVLMNGTLTPYSLQYASTTPTTGTFEIGWSGFDRAVGYANGCGIINFHDSLIPQFSMATGCGSWLAFTNNLLWQQDNVGGNPMVAHGDVSGTYVLADYDTYNPHVFGSVMPFTWDLGVMENTGNGGDGDGISIDQTSDASVFKHIVSMPNRARVMACCTFISSTDTSASAITGYTIEHNTFWGGPASDHAIKGNEQGAFKTGVVKYYRSNLYYDTIAQGNHFFTCCPGVPPPPGQGSGAWYPYDNVGNPAQMTYNGSWNAITSSWPGKTSDGTYYNIPTTVTIPGGNDVHADPQFVDSTRSVSWFDTGYLGKSIGTAWAVGQSYVIGDIRSLAIPGQWSGKTINYRAIQNHTSSAVNQPLVSHVFTISAANATVGAMYHDGTNVDSKYYVAKTISGATSLSAMGTRDLPASGTLVKDTGTGDATITYSSWVNSDWHQWWELASMYWARQAFSTPAIYTDPSIGCGAGCTAALALVKWVQAGFAPTNPAYHNTAHDGGDIGAVAYAGGAGGPLTLSPSSPLVMQGNTVTFVASGGTAPYTLSLTTGSVGTFNPATGLYTAPASIAARNQMYGVQLHSNSHIYNTPINALPVHASSATWLSNVASTNGANLLPDMPVNTVLSTDPATAVVFKYSPPSISGNFIVPPLKRDRIEGGYYLWNIAGGVDRHGFEVISDSQEIEETYGFPYPLTWDVGCPTCNAQSGRRYAAMSSNLLTDLGNTTAGGNEVPALLLKYSELASGSAIQHAFRMTFSQCIDTTHALWPSIGPAPAGSTCIPYGARLRLKSTFTPTWGGGCNATCQGYGNAIITALKNYGVIQDDIGAMGAISMEQVPYYTRDMIQAIWEVGNQSTSVKTQFEVVDESSLMVSSTSGEVNWSNIYVVPSGAQVCVTDAIPNTVCQTVRLQGVTVGTPERTLAIQAGTPAYQLQAWVNGATDKTITWSMSPSVGTLNTTTGVYTAPATITANTKSVTTITATSNADNTKSVTIGVTIFPTGTIRLNLGDDTDYSPDSQGNKWFAQFKSGDPIIAATGPDKCGTGFPCGDQFQSNWSGTSDPFLFSRVSYGANDKNYHFIVPNGTYQFTYYSGDNTGTLAYARTMNLILQNTVFQTDYDAVAQVGSGVAASVSGTVLVTDNNLWFSARAHGYNLATPPTNPCCNGNLYLAPMAPGGSAISIVAVSPPSSLTTTIYGIMPIIGGITIR